MSRVLRRGLGGFVIGVGFWLSQITIAYAASDAREDGISRPFNVMWLVMLMLTIAVFLTMAYLDHPIDLRENQDNANA